MKEYTNWDDHKLSLLKNLKFKQALKETKLEYQIARAIIEARVNKKLTQNELAKKLNTRQSVISRVENAKTTPSLSFLKRLASVMGTTLQVSFR